MNSPPCEFYCKIDRPVEQVFNAVYLPEHLSAYFATGMASGKLDAETKVQWAFHDFPNFSPFDVKITECVRNQKIVLFWDGVGDTINRVTFLFESLEDSNQCKVSVSETGWIPDEQGYNGCIENSGGWANMITCLKVYVEHGIQLRKFMF